MNILIPMAGEGKRFQEKGYTVSKPAILTYDRRTGKKLPMVVCATLDLPGFLPDGSNIIYIDRDFHKKNGTEQLIQESFPKATFITLDHLTEGQASSCLSAKEYIARNGGKEEFLIAGCDNGMEFDNFLFEEKKENADILVFTYRHNQSVLANPNAYGWMITDNSDTITGTSIKKAISDNPLEDHAVVATFWFRTGNIFLAAAEKMIAENDRINNEFYVDQTIKHAIELGYAAKVFEIDRYIGWGTPSDYEQYQKTFEYWNGFFEREQKFLD